MDKKCKICGTTENVNFDGMCKKCYNDSIVLHEKNAEEIKKEEIEDKRKRRENFDFTWIQIVIVIIFIIVVAYTLGKNDNSSNNTVNNVSSNSSSTISKNSANVSTKIEKPKNTSLVDNLTNKKILTAKNNYRFKNTIDEVTLVFEEIYIISQWNGIKPHNDYFLIMKATASSNTPSDNPYNFPYLVSSSNKKEYISINNRFNYNYEDLEGNTVDPATEMNLEYVKKDEGKISAYNTDFVSGGNGTRYLVFDISKETAEDSDIYFEFIGTTRDIYKEDAPSKNIYFSEYIEKR